jgi:phage terminase large subunit
VTTKATNRRKLSKRDATLIRWRRDPAAFISEALGDPIYPKQAEMARSLANNPRTSVVGCNASGKDWTAGRLVLWHQCMFSPAMTVVLGPTGRQVKDVVWGELRAAYLGSPVVNEFGMRLYESARMQRVRPDGRMDPQHYAVGMSTNNPYNIQGFHSPNLLVVVTEAHSVEQDDIEALRRLNPTRWLLTGNPFAEAGEFYDSHHSLRDFYNPIAISAYDTPNVILGERVVPGMVTREDIEDRKVVWGEDSTMFKASILGEFADGLSDAIVPLSAATAAAQRDKPSDPSGRIIYAVDVARGGQDKSIVARRQGTDVQILWKHQGNDTMRIAAWLMQHFEEKERPGTVAIDAVGVGAGLFDRMRELRPKGVKVVPFIGGQTAVEPKKYQNRVAESWWLMRLAYLNKDEPLTTTNDKALIGQVSSRKYSIQSDQRIKLESKEKLFKSPDEADAVAMTFDRRVSRAGGLGIYV